MMKIQIGMTQKVSVGYSYVGEGTRTSNTIKLVIENNTILVPVRLQNNLEGYFILDTGVSYPIITEPLIARLLPLNYLRTIKIRGYGSQPPLEAVVASNFQFQIGETTHRHEDYVILLNQSLGLDQQFDAPVYGIVGHSFLQDKIIKINYQNSTMRIWQKNKKKRWGKKYKPYSITFKNERPFIQAQVKNGGNQLDVFLLIDTGFSGAFSLYPQHKSILKENQKTIHNYIGKGMNGFTENEFFKLESLKLNFFPKLTDVSTIIPDQSSLVNVTVHKYSDGSIGNDIMRRFHVVFDYESKTIFMKKNQAFFEKFSYNACGFTMFIDQPMTSNRTVKISKVQNESNADKVGLKVNDRLLRINGNSVKHKSLKEIYKILNNRDELKKDLFIERNDSTFTVQLILNTEI